MNLDFIRNFCIIAHIDHGKSTLADRLLELTGTVEPRQMQAQFLDRLSLEREKGITIKLKAVRMAYRYQDREYELNLIDTPGHVDFSYEVSRSLAACEGALVVVDATQGIQAQTLSHVNRAKESGLTLIPIINKIDMANARVEVVKKALTETFGMREEEMLEVSAKTGLGVEKVLEAIVNKIPSPSPANQLIANSLRALVFDSFYDEHKGVVAVIKVASGQLSVARGEKLKFYQSQVEFEPLEVGCFSPDAKVLTALSAGEVGYVATGFKDVSQVRVGDTLLEVEPQREGVQPLQNRVQPLPGYKEPKPMVFAGLYPLENQDYLKLRQALGKLHLTDASFTYTPESSPALGNGFRGGFLGLLHAEVVQERLEREFDLSLISTTPNVVYEASLTSGKELTVNSAAELPDPTQVKEIREPWVKMIIYSPSSYIGAVMKLSEEKRALFQEMNYLGSSQTVRLIYEMPLAEMMVDFFDRLKSISAGYASLDWEFIDFRPAEAVKLDIYVHQELVEPLSQIVIKEKAERVGRQLVLKLKEVIPPQQFPVAIQAAIGGKIIARETVSARHKDVLAKMSGGHRERKDKLLEAQKKGKKRMKMFGQVAIPQEAFRTVLAS